MGQGSGVYPGVECMPMALMMVYTLAIHNVQETRLLVFVRRSTFKFRWNRLLPFACSRTDIQAGGLLFGSI